MSLHRQPVAVRAISDSRVPRSVFPWPELSDFVPVMIQNAWFTDDKGFAISAVRIVTVRGGGRVSRPKAAGEGAPLSAGPSVSRSAYAACKRVGFPWLR